jgi:hypothetical protein
MLLNDYGKNDVFLRRASSTACLIGCARRRPYTTKQHMKKRLLPSWYKINLLPYLLQIIRRQTVVLL